MAINVNGWPETRSAGVIPQITNGKQIMIRNTFFQVPKRNNRIPSIRNNVNGIYLRILLMASFWIPISPIHLSPYPSGSSIDSISFLIEDTTLSGVAQSLSGSGSHSASIARRPLKRRTTLSSGVSTTLSATDVRGTVAKSLSLSSDATFPEDKTAPISSSET